MILALLVCATAAHAGRYRVTINFGDGRPFVIYSGDADLAALWANSSGLAPGMSGGPMPAVPLPGNLGAPAAPPTGAGAGAARIPGARTPLPPSTAAGAGVLTTPRAAPPAPPRPPPPPATPTPTPSGGPTGTPPPPSPPSNPPPPTPATPPDQAFTDLLKSIYLVQDQAVIDGAWAYYQQEDASLPMGPRAGNAVIKYAMANKGTPVGDADVNGLSALSGVSTATVRTSTGVGVRSAPWGASVDSASQGASLTVLGPPDADGWVHVTYNGKDGYVSGLWLSP